MSPLRFAAPALVLVASCAEGGVLPGERGTSRPAGKRTCPTIALRLEGAREVDRVLVPLAPQVLGSEQSFEFDDSRITLISGGYFDDITEPFDDLVVDDHFDIRGTTADVLRGQYLNDAITVVLWRESSTPVPCDAHAAIVAGGHVGTTNSALDAIRDSGLEHRTPSPSPSTSPSISPE